MTVMLCIHAAHCPEDKKTPCPHGKPHPDDYAHSEHRDNEGCYFFRDSRCVEVGE